MRLRNDRREQRKEEGAERNEAWRKLSTPEQLASLRARRGESKRQIAKLTK